MSVKKKRRHQNATPRESSNSKDVRSRGTASKKSVKSKSEKKLTVATPRNSESQFLEHLGLLAPVEMDGVDEIDVLLDLTHESSRSIGRQHSTWAAFHSYALFVLARLESRKLHLERERRHRAAKFRQKYGGEYKTKYELDDAALLDAKISAVDDELSRIEQQAVQVRALVDGYAGFRNGVSREISRREAEKAQT